MRRRFVIITILKLECHKTILRRGGHHHLYELWVILHNKSTLPR